MKSDNADPAGGLPPVDAAARIACVHADRCGGCPLLPLPYGEQLDHKRERVRAALGRYPHLAESTIEAPLAAATLTSYRTRAKLAVAAGARLGLYRGLAHEVVDIPECRVLSPALAATAGAIRALLAAPPDAAGAALVAYTRRGKGALLGVDLREVRGEQGDAERALATLVVARERSPSGRAARAGAEALLAAAPALLGVALSRRAALSPRFFGDAPEPLAGEVEAPDRVGEAVVTASPGAFVQAHRAQAARLGQEVAARLDERLGGLANRRVLELFAGSGAIGRGLASRGAKVTLVESSPTARNDGTVKVLASDALDASRALAAANERFDAVVVDPPRRGLAPALRVAVAALAGRALVYVSCEPRTLARDLAHLAWLGLRVVRVQPLDMIPLSDEVEVIVTLAPGPLPELTVLHEDDELLAIDKPPHLAVAADTGPTLLERVRARAPDAVPLFAPDAAASGVALFARQSGLALPKDALVTYRAWARGITRPRGSVSRPLVDRGQQHAARTKYSRREVTGGHSLLDVEAAPGKRHEVQRHLAAIGHPIVGDRRHGHEATNRHFEERAGLDRPFLHARRVELGLRGRELVIESPLAGDLEEVLATVADDA